MATTLLHRRGSTLDAAEFTGGPAELYVDIQLNKLYIHDGVTKGGYELLVANDGYYTSAEVDSAITTAINLYNPDLTNYYSKAETDALFTPYYTSSQIDTFFTSYYTKSALDVHLSDGTVSSIQTPDLTVTTNSYLEYLEVNTVIDTPGLYATSYIICSGTADFNGGNNVSGEPGLISFKSLGGGWFGGNLAVAGTIYGNVDLSLSSTTNLVEGDNLYYTDQRVYDALDNIPGTTFGLLRTLDNPNVFGTSENDLFGEQVEIYGDYAIVSASYEDSVSLLNVGRVYVFKIDTGELIHVISPPNPTAGSFGFGQIVKAYDGHVLIGDQNAQTAYLFNIETAEQIAEYPNPQPAYTSYAFKGILTEKYAVVAEHNNHFVYVFDKFTGNLKHTINDKCYGLAGNNSYIICGQETVGIYDIDTGSLIRQIINPNVVPTSVGFGDSFGDYIALAGNYVAISAPGEDQGAQDAGVVYVFDVTTGDLLYRLDNPYPPVSNGNKWWGEGTSAFGDYLYVGGEFINNWEGQAYLYNIRTGELLETISNPNTGNTADDSFSYQSSLSDTHLIISAYGTEDTYEYSGKAYIYTLPKNETTITQKIYDVANEVSYNVSKHAIDSFNSNLGTISTQDADAVAITGGTIVADTVQATYTETHTVLSGTTPVIDCSLGNSFELTLSGDTTFTTSNKPGVGQAFVFALTVKQDASASGYLVTWFDTITWASGSVPTLTATANAEDVFVFYTKDQGVTWFGVRPNQ